MTSPGAPVGRLIVCPTPIGNLADVTLRVLEELGRADAIACEDTRHSRVLLDRHGIGGSLVSLHEHNESARARALCERIAGGETVALVSDAGMPLISDPGYELVRACLERDLPVEVLPGPSAPVTALVASGLPADRWCFTGFLPRRAGELRALLDGATQTLVAFESPRRLTATLAVLAEAGPSRPVAVCRELTKLHEEIARGTAAELAERFGRTPPKGEIVLVIGAAEAGSAEREPALRALRDLVAAGARPRPAAKAVASLTGVAANELYRELTGTSE
jgi:16S rRNA (cytidine1402-2'-O)-methyltransferase